ncbi:MAG: cytochrome c oxidase subunit II [Xenococcaceae cyanobacterium MO_188.B29]|nr:cytochrome c oxidase subunit II [Xenococcaceae cyanobacterium MO_188.B29]
MNIPSNIVTLIAGIALTLISLWYGQNHGLLPIAASNEAGQVDELFNLMMTIATGLFLLVEGVIIYSVIKFRRKQGDTTDGPPIEGNVPLEIVWTAIPTVIVFILAIYSFEVYNAMGGLDPMASHDMRPKQQIAMNTEGKEIALGLGASPESEQSNAPLMVNVNGIQYAWIFTYPDTGIIAGDLHVPIDRPVQLNINASDVIHAFWLPEFRIKQDAIPGRDAQLTFTPNRVGQYPVICAELCGAYHGGMKTTLTVHTAEDYEQWVQDNTFAQADNPQESVALNISNSSDQEFLAPYAEDLGIEAEAIAQLHPDHHH